MIKTGKQGGHRNDSEFFYASQTDHRCGLRTCQCKGNSKLGKVCLIVTGKTSAKVSGALQDVTDTLDSNGQKWVLFDEIGQNPKLTDCIAAPQTTFPAYLLWRVFDCCFRCSTGWQKMVVII